MAEHAALTERARQTMHIREQGTLYDARVAPPEARFATFAVLARLGDGSLAASFRVGSAKDSPDEDNRVMLSEDDGATWRTVFAGFGDVPPGRGRIRCLAVSARGERGLAGSLNWIDRSDPSLPLFNPVTEGILPTRVLYGESDDRGATWTAPRQVDLAPHRGNAITGPILALRDGRLALPYEAWKEYDDAAPGRHHASLRISSDGGATWPEAVVVAHDPAGRVLYWDQRLSVDPHSGTIYAMFWTHDRQAGRDLDLHLATGTPDGRSWTRPASTGIAGQICAPLAVGGPRIFAAYVHRHYPPGLRAILSDDYGRTWQAAPELVLFEKMPGSRESGMEAAGPGASAAGRSLSPSKDRSLSPSKDRSLSPSKGRDFADYWADMSIWTFGHPAPLLLPGGDVLVAYYASDETAMSIRWVRIALDLSEKN